MAAYEYQALTTKGRTDKGVLEADTERQVRVLLRERGLTPLNVEIISEKKRAGKKTRFGIGRSISTADLALITRQFATLVRAGMTVEQCLNALIEQTESPKTRSILAGVRGNVLEGQALSTSMAAFPNAFPDIFRFLIDAGEQSGQLDQILERLAVYMENRQALQQKVFQAFIYPIVVSVFAIIIVVILMAYVVPQVTRVFINTGQELPWLTSTLITISDIITTGGVWWLVLFAGLFFAIRAALAQHNIKLAWHKLLLKMPITSRLTRGVNAERLANTLGILTASGIPLLNAMQSAVQVVTNLPMRAAVENALNQIREGGSLSRALGQAKLFPPLVIHLIASGESSGKLDMMLTRAAEAQSRELENWVKTFTSLLEPLLIVIMGVVVLLIVMAILLPIFQMNQLIR